MSELILRQIQIPAWTQSLDGNSLSEWDVVCVGEPAWNQPPQHPQPAAGPSPHPPFDGPGSQTPDLRVHFGREEQIPLSFQPFFDYSSPVCPLSDEVQNADITLAGVGGEGHAAHPSQLWHHRRQQLLCHADCRGSRATGAPRQARPALRRRGRHRALLLRSPGLTESLACSWGSW